jgi:hypothetical protein
MQIAMVGSGCIVIASDTLCSHPPTLRQGQLWVGGTRRTNSRKILISHEHGFVISCARNMELARQIAHELIARFSDREFIFSTKAVEDIAAKISVGLTKPDAQCLIALTRPKLRLFLFTFGIVDGEWGPFCQEQFSKAIAGDNVNSAIFWVEGYYKESLPASQLIPLAAQMVATAGHLNPYLINGLEIAVCNGDGCHRLSDESILCLKKKASEWDIEIGNLFRNYPEQITYAPDTDE